MTPIKDFTKRQHRKFTQAEGSQYIASEYAVLQIIKLIKKFQPKHILEVGVGIGTISDSIIKAGFGFQPIVYGIENNRFCLDQIPGNLGDSYGELRLFHGIHYLPRDIKFDLIVIDGKEEYLENLKDSISPRCILIIEGDRKDQVESLRFMFPKHKFAPMVSIKRNSKFSKKDPNEFQGGIKLIFINPNLEQLAFWFKTKVIMKLKYFKRDYFS
ncbi:class I SAM-dependent methyltransferase [Gramella sp. GC03-9]|uniref:Class I SAM-dependent methyltransferase n=1 Tax=Christiangramia oceanisediminis TaxID=2920386 RepID=A0A9X2I6U1_9FLAO|nr:class I SAM-dependent methyltransferase [Gramella oceanisediminis]MCP9198307.1 class I SAM-dependent methyltransferase [Gramella oceanisediminis]